LRPNAENITHKVLEKEGTKNPYASRVVKVAAPSVADTQTETAGEKHSASRG